MRFASFRRARGSSSSRTRSALARVSSFTRSQRRLVLPALNELGWDADWASAFEQLHEDNLIAARVAAQHRGAYVVWTADGELRAQAAGRLFYAHEVGEPIPAVGDWVGVRGETVTSILPRRSAFIRKRAGLGSDEQVLAANVDAAFLLAGLDDDFSLRRLERYITTAWDSGAEPVVVLTKADLCDDVAGAMLQVESVAIGVPVYPISNVTGVGIEALAAHCRFRDCAHAREPGCAVLAAVDNGTLTLDRLRSWRKFQRELESIAARTDLRLRAARKKRWKELAAHARQRPRL